LIDPVKLYNFLKKNNINFFSGIPDSLLKDFCAVISEKESNKNHIIAANEGNALALSIGYYLATEKLSLVYMQNSGMGNIINPLVSLADTQVYSIPLILMIGWRGEPGVEDEPQHIKQGKITKELLKTCGIPFVILDSKSTMDSSKEKLKKLFENAINNRTSSAILVKKNTFKKYGLKKINFLEKKLTREDVLEFISKELSKDSAIVSTTGVTSRELYEIRKKRGESNEQDFLTVGGMGHSNQIALGIALSLKNKQIFCLDGDGALLMHMGSASIIGTSKAKNFKHIVFNNSSHDSVGAQPTIAKEIDIIKIANACGYNWAERVSSMKELKSKFPKFKKINGPAILEIIVKPGFRKDLGRPTSSTYENKEAFINFLKK
tara:strand:- start:30 stop:1163 length:1134 start_codon:yes stop_codon:yes gene_type:complete